MSSGDSKPTGNRKRIRAAVRRANMRYGLKDFQTGHEFIPLYLANGWVGGCFDEFGFPSQPDFGYDHGRRLLGYTNHYYRCANGGHNQAGLLAIEPSRADGRGMWLGDLTRYRQELDLYTMTLTTAWSWGEAEYHVAAFASMDLPELMEMAFSCRLPLAGDGLCLRLQFELLAAENNGYRWTPGLMDALRVEMTEERDGWRVRSTTNCRCTELLVQGVGFRLVREGADLVAHIPEGKSALRLLVLDAELGARREEAIRLLGKPAMALGRAHREAAAQWWDASGLFLPQGPAADVWTRSVYYLAASVAPFPAHIMIPTGLNGNIWKHGFPQDMYYVVENLPRLGHLDRALAQMPYWLENLEAVKRYTRRIADREGAFYPWIPPFQDWDGFEKEGPTNPDSFEFHNSGYVAAMVWNLFRVTGDRGFLEQHFPILEGIARFYLSLTEFSADGKAHIRHPDLRSQDEASRETGEKSDALCCIWAALYTLRAYHEACGILDRAGAVAARTEAVLSSGYDLAALERPDGHLRTYREDDRPIGQQKHPVQLNVLCYLPLPDMIDHYAPVRKAWRDRYDLTQNARLPQSMGWTFGEFTLASARMRSGAEVARDLAMVQPARFSDPYWIQFYESSMREPWHMKKAYYFTASGLYLQALTDCVVQYCRGVVDLFAALLPEWERQSFWFHGLRTDGGLRIGGEWRAGAFRVAIEPTRDVEMALRVSRDVRGIRLSEQDGEARTLDGNTDVAIRWRAGRTVTLVFDAAARTAETSDRGHGI